jgi:hypothetical protein
MLSLDTFIGMMNDYVARTYSTDSEKELSASLL